MTIVLLSQMKIYDWFKSYTLCRCHVNVHLIVCIDNQPITIVAYIWLIIESNKYFDIQYWLTTSFLVWWLTIEKNYKSLTHNIDWQPVFLSADLLLNTTIFYFQYWLTAVDLQFSSESVALEWGSKTGLAKYHLAPDKSQDTEVTCVSQCHLK